MGSQIHDVAIVGMSCRLPGEVNDLDDLWEFCAKSRCAARAIPESRFQAAQYYHPDRSKKGHFHTEAGSFLEADVGAFDAPFFNISEAEAKSLDPQHRLMLETAFLALENAGIDITSFSGRSDVGVFAAGAQPEYQERFHVDPYHSPVYAAPSNAATMFANRVSYFLNLKGPSITVDTACSSALSALHLAVESIKTGECSCAIVGGSCLQLSPYMISYFSNLGTLGKDGISYSFDHRASGYGRGEGSICIVLRSSYEASRNNDCIRAIIRGSGVNHVGRSQGITLPDGQAQADLITRVYQSAGLSPHDTAYVEAHGTGTERGDPIEAESIALGLNTEARGSEHPMYIGSIKSNFGHLEYVSGLASVIKCVAMLERGVILPSANFEKANPAIDMDRLNLAVPVQCIQWPQGVRRASVNNFGFGGSNAHIVLEQAPLASSSRMPSEESAPRLFAFSAKDKDSLQAVTEAITEWLPRAADDDEFLVNLSYTLCCRRTHFPYRYATYASTKGELLQKLQRLSGIERLSNSRKAFFLFTGQGSQWPQMGLSLMRYHVFAAAMHKSEKVLESLGAAWSLLDEVSKSAEKSRINDAIISQPAVTALQVSLVCLLRAWGLSPTSVCGHSSGEIAAAFAAGFLDLEIAIGLAYYRGEAASKMSKSGSASGGMMAVGADPDYVESLISSLRDGIATIACYNSPQSVTVSGDRAAILELSTYLKEAEVFHRILRVDVAYHSDHMISAAGEYYHKAKELLSSCKPKASATRFFSSVNGKPELGPIVASPWYWVTNLVCPVQFSKAVDSLISASQPGDLVSFIEIGPHSTLKGPLRDIVQARENTHNLDDNRSPGYLPTLIRISDGCEDVLNLASTLLNRGFMLQPNSIFESLHEVPGHQLLTNVPFYRFNKSRRYWHETRLTRETWLNGSAWHMLLGHRITGTVGYTLEFRNVFSLDDMPWLRDHQVNGEVLFPAAGYFSMAIEAIKFASQNGPERFIDGYRLRETSVGKAWRLSEGSENEVFTILRPRASGTRISDAQGWFSFQILSWSEQDGFSEHCSGLIALEEGKTTDLVSPSALRLTKGKRLRELFTHLETSSGRQISPKALYEQLGRVGLWYGPAFARVASLRTGDDGAVGTIAGMDLSQTMPFNFETLLEVHPAALDAALHVGLCNLGGNNGDPSKVRVYVPTFLQELFVSNRFQLNPEETLAVYAHDIVAEKMSRSSGCSLTCLSPGSQELTLEITGLTVFDVQEEAVVTSSADMINPLVVEWSDHMSFSQSDCLSNWEDAEVDVVNAASEMEALERQAYHLIKWALSVNESEPEKDSHLHLLWEWMNSVVSSHSPYSKSDVPEDKMWKFVDEVASRSFQGALNAKVGRQLPAILNQEVDEMNVLFQQDGLWRVYEESMFFSRSNRQLAELVDRLGQESPNLRILEVGAGTGGLASKLLSKLTSNGEASRRYDVYDYTDISTGFLDNAKVKFAQYQGINYKLFDVSKDPVEQGFEESHYDLVVAMDVIHATPDAAQSLRNIRKLLKPNATLAMVELNEFKLHLFPFATLSGWWHKPNGPVISQYEWQDMLLSSGYTGIDAAIDDFPHIGLQKLYWTHAKESNDPPVADVHLIQVQDQLPPTSLAAEVGEYFQRAFSQKGITLPLASLQNKKGTFILFDEELFLENMTATQFEALQGLLYYAEGLLWVTRSSDPMTRLVSGCARTFQLENPHLRLSVLHLDPDNSSHPASKIIGVWDHVFLKTPKEAQPELEYREVKGRIQIPRLVPSEMLHKAIGRLSNETVIEEEQFVQGNRSLELTIGTVGLFSTLFFKDNDVASTTLADNEVLIRIEATGLNFKDIMIGLGSLPWQSLGREASGVVVASGKQAQAELPVGSRVLHWGDALLATHAKGTRNNMVKIPHDLTFEEAASVPVVYTTAYESLINLARLQSEERVLIHAAAGGVGQAAIMIAQWIGAEVFCTVGSPEKKDLIMRLYDIPEDHIFSSRNVSFAQGLLAATEGAGVDVILNSLAGDLLRASWQCIAKFGRFIDISKRDAVANAYLEMAPFDRSVTYTALDLSLYPDTGKRGRIELTKDTLKLFETKAVRPVHPINVIPVTEIESAFRMLQQGKHMGKVVIRNDDRSMVKVKRKQSSNTKLSEDGSYIITGGVGGLGQYLARLLLEKGARYIVLASRNAENAVGSNSMQELINMAIERNGRVLIVSRDVGSFSEVQNMVETAKKKGMPPIKGVIHGAMVLKDAMFENTSLQNWKSVIRPKVHGALNLHRALINEPLDFFICLSSLVGTVGNAGQSSYAGSNAFLDEFCAWRTRQGLPAASIALPAVSDVGYVASRAEVETSLLQSSNLYKFNVTGEQVGHLVEAAIVAQDLGSHIVAGISTKADVADNAFMQNLLFSQIRNRSMSRDLSTATKTSGTSSRVNAQPTVDREALSQATSIEAASKIVFQAVTQKIAQDMMISPQDILPESSLAQIGLDSLVAVEFRNWLAKELDASVRVMAIINSKSLDDLVSLVVRQSSLLARLHVNGHSQDAEASK